MWRQWVVTAIGGLLWACTPALCSTELSIGFLQDFSYVPGFTYPLLGAARVAVDVVNTDPSFSPYFNLKLVVLDSMGDPRRAAISTLSLIQDSNVSVIIGPTYSMPAMASQYVASLFSVPQISPTATSVLLGNKNSFPLFMRTNGGSYTDLLARFVWAMGWQNVALLTHLNTFSIQEKANFVEHADNAKLSIKLQLDFTASDYKEKLAALRVSGVRVVVLFCYESEAAKILEEAQRQNMTLGYQWIGNNDWVRTSGHARDLTVGVLGLVPRIPINSVLESGWRKTEEGGRGERDDQDMLYPGYTGNIKEINWGAEAAYAAVMVFAEAARFLMMTGRSIANGTLLYKTMATTKLKDAEGRKYVEFSNRTGDRVMDYLIINGRKNGSYIEIGAYKRKRGFVLNNETVLFMGGTTEHPNDTVFCAENTYFSNGICNSCPAYQCSPGGLTAHCRACEKGFQYSDTLKLVLVIIGSIGIATCIVMAIYTFIRRENKLIIGSSPPLLALTLVGGIMSFSWAIALGSEGSTPLCIVRLWLKYLGFALLYGSLSVKSYNIASFFSVTDSRPLTHKGTTLILLFCGYIGIFLVYLIFWSAVSPPVYSEQTYSDDFYTYAYMDCNTAGVWGWVGQGLMIILMVWCMMVSFSVRHAPACYHECNYLWYACTFSVLIGIVTMITKLTYSPTPNVTRVLDATFILTITFAAVLLLFLPKIYAIETSLARARRRRKEGKTGTRSTEQGTSTRGTSTRDSHTTQAARHLRELSSSALTHRTVTLNLGEVEHLDYLEALQEENKGLRGRLDVLRDQFVLLGSRQTKLHQRHRSIRRNAPLLFANQEHYAASAFTITKSLSSMLGSNISGPLLPPGPGQPAERSLSGRVTHSIYHKIQQHNSAPGGGSDLWPVESKRPRAATCRRAQSPHGDTPEGVTSMDPPTPTFALSPAAGKTAINMPPPEPPSIHVVDVVDTGLGEFSEPDSNVDEGYGTRGNRASLGGEGTDWEAVSIDSSLLGPQETVSEGESHPPEPKPIIDPEPDPITVQEPDLTMDPEPDPIMVQEPEPQLEAPVRPGALSRTTTESASTPPEAHTPSDSPRGSINESGRQRTESVSSRRSQRAPSLSLHGGPSWAGDGEEDYGAIGYSDDDGLMDSLSEESEAE